MALIIFRSKYNIPLILTLLVFGSIFCAISLVNHYLFRTEALDLGGFNHAIYKFSKLEQGFYSLSLDGSVSNYFSGHFSPITIILSPFRYIFGTYTLLILQIAAVIFGGFGVFKLAVQAGIKHWLSTMIVVQFLSIWSIYSALSFDYHNNVLAAMFVPWLVYFYRSGTKRWFVFFYILILISKENMALWMIFIMLGLMLQNRSKWKGYVKFELPLLLFAIAYTIIVLGSIMPAYTASGENVQFDRYGYLGEGILGKLQTLLYHPKETFELFFYESRFPGAPEGIKWEFHWVMLLSGGLFVFLNPRYLVMLIPIYAQKFLSSHIGNWGIDAQYSIEYAPIISLAIIDTARSLGNIRSKAILVSGVTLTTIAVSITVMEERVIPFYDNTNVAFYRAEHYDLGLDPLEISKALSLIPDKSPISVSSNLAPHLAFRDSVFLFPNIRSAEYIVLIHTGRKLYPTNRDRLYTIVDSLIEMGAFDLIHFGNYMMVLRNTGVAQKLPAPLLTRNARVRHYIRLIKNDPTWLETVQKKAILKGIPIDSMVHLDAVFLTDADLEEKLQEN